MFQQLSCIASHQLLLCRYATMKTIQLMPGGDNIKAFTRIMHRSTDDDLVGEVGAAFVQSCQLSSA